ncbi:MAG: hypothetical protein ACFFBP_19765 [Promethearchaeota archaeon]
MVIFDWSFIISGFIFFITIIIVFLLVIKEKMKLVKIIGIILTALIFPLVLVLINYILIQKDIRFIIFILLILSYLIVELILDYILKYDFRSNTKTHVPYIILEYAACFSFVFGALSLNLVMGWVMSFLFWALLGILIYYIILKKRKEKLK